MLNDLKHYGESPIQNPKIESQGSPNESVRNPHASIPEVPDEAKKFEGTYRGRKFEGFLF
jgi:hypothetical protein